MTIYIVLGVIVYKSLETYVMLNVRLFPLYPIQYAIEVEYWYVCMVMSNTCDPSCMK